MTLGRNDAALSPSFIEGLTLEGPIGHTGKFLCHAPFAILFSLFYFTVIIYSHGSPLFCSKENSILDQITYR